MNRAKVIIVFFFAILSIYSISGQNLLPSNIYEAIIKSDSNNENLEDVICLSIDKDNKTLNYAFSDANGFVSLEISNQTQYIQFRLLGYSTLNIPINNIKKGEVIRLSESAINLKEVIVSIPPIQSNNDTLKYDVNSFRNQNDKYISDILKKLPGIKVSENGTISYMGESINKFYIEGRDLLGGQYNIASNNLDVDAVNTIELLQNNQHIKALKGISFDGKAAINIKLKKGYKSRPFGEAQAGAGGTPFLYDSKALITYLGSNTQSLFNLKGLNTGDVILNELEDKFDLNDLFSFEPIIQPYATAPSPRNVPLPIKRHIFNKTGLGSANSLVPISKSSELKINLAYGLDKTDQDFNLLQEYAIKDDFLKVNESSRQQNKINNMRLAITFEHNADNQYLKNELIYFKKKKRVNALLNTTSDDEYNKVVDGDNKVDYLQNNFQAITKLKNNRTLRINSLLRYETNKDLLLDTHKETKLIDEVFRTKSIVNRNRVSTSFNFLSNKLDIGLITTYKQKEVTNQSLFEQLDAKVTPTPFQEIKTKRAEIGIDPSYQIQSENKRLVLTIDLPTYYSRYFINNYTNKKTTDARVIFTPSISTTWILNHKWEFHIKEGYSFDYGNDQSLLGGAYFAGYRAIFIPSNDFNHNKNLFTAGRVRYKNIVSMFFFNLNILYKFSTRNYINTFNNTPEWSYYSTQKEHNKSNLFSISADLSKTISSCKLLLILNPTYTRLNSRLIQQDKYVRNTSNVFSLTTSAEWKGIPKLSFSYKAIGDVVWNNNNLTATTPLKSLTQYFGIYYFPNPKLDISLTSDYVIYEKSKNDYSKYFFLDFKTIYRHKSLEYGLLITNILNKSTFSITELSSVNIYRQQIPLREREFLAYVKFKI